MAAGLGFKTFTTGEVLTAADVNGYLMQGVLVFASAAARNAAITSPQEGQFAFTKDTNGLWYYDGAAWVASGATGDIEGVTAGVGITGGGTSGTVTITNDMATTITASGDIVVGTGSGTYDNLPIGTTGQILTADTTVSPYKVKWASAASGGSMTLLSTTTLSGAATITISSISQSYTNLYILATGINVTAGNYTLKIIPNNSNSSNYTSLQEGTIGGNNANYISPGNAGHSAADTVNDFALTFFNYTSTDSRKPFMLFGVSKMASQVAPLGLSSLGAFNSNSAISSMVFSNDSGGNFVAGTVKIYGVN
jgi:hypothetical protein